MGFGVTHIHTTSHIKLSHSICVIHVSDACHTRLAFNLQPVCTVLLGHMTDYVSIFTAVIDSHCKPVFPVPANIIRFHQPLVCICLCTHGDFTLCYPEQLNQLTSMREAPHVGLSVAYTSYKRMCKKESACNCESFPANAHFAKIFRLESFAVYSIVMFV